MAISTSDLANPHTRLSEIQMERHRMYEETKRKLASQQAVRASDSTKTQVKIISETGNLEFKQQLEYYLDLEYEVHSTSVQGTYYYALMLKHPSKKIVL